MTKAVVDVGSNSVLLLVAKKGEAAWETLSDSSEVTGLGEGTKSTGLLSERGMRDTLAAVKKAFNKARELGASEVLAAATMAARIAKNTDEFLQRAKDQGTPVFILSGEQEAQFGFWSVVDDPLFGSAGSIAIIDVGGQSTEVVVAERADEDWKVSFKTSFPIGTLALRDGVLSDPSPGAGDRLRASTLIDEALGGTVPKDVGLTVCLGATGTNLVSIRDRLPEWQPEKVHGAVLSFEEVGRAVGWLCSMSDEERAGLVGIEPGRERTVHIGALILERVMHALRAEESAVSIRGWRYALLERGLP